MVLDAQIEIANQINNAVLEFNSAVNSINKNSEDKVLKNNALIEKINDLAKNDLNTTLIRSEIKAASDKVKKLELLLSKQPSKIKQLINVQNGSTIDKLKGLIPDYFDPTSIEKEIKKLMEFTEKQRTETEENKIHIKELLKKLDLNKQDLSLYKESNEEKISSLQQTVSILKAELKSARKTLGLQIGKIESKVNEIKEVK